MYICILLEIFDFCPLISLFSQLSIIPIRKHYKPTHGGLYLNVNQLTYSKDCTRQYYILSQRRRFWQSGIEISDAVLSSSMTYEGFKPINNQVVHPPPKKKRNM